MSVSIAEEYLRVTEPLQVDTSVDSYLYREYLPVTGTNLNNVNSEIRIVLEHSDVFTHPAGSYLYVKGRLTKADGTAFVDADLITLANNGIAFLFNNIKYHVGDKQIDDLNYPGYATTMKGLISYGSSDQASLLGGCWKLDDSTNRSAAGANTGFAARHDAIIKQTNPKGCFSFVIPASHLLGFFEDYDKIIYGAKQTLTLMRASNADALFKAAAVVDAANVTLDRISWHIPHVVPSDAEKLRLYRLIDGGGEIKMGFRHWHYDSTELPQTTSHTWRLITTSAIEKPRWIVLGFQTDRSESSLKNPAVFDHLSLTDCYATLNGERYPYLDLNLNYGTGDYATLYRMFLNYRKSNYYSNDACVDFLHFKNTYPLIVIDCTKQRERLQTSVVDVQVKMRFSTAVPASTKCHALLIGDRMMKLKLEQGRVEVVY